MPFDLAFYQFDHRLIAIAMLAVLAIAVETGFRLGPRKQDAPEIFRALMSGIGAAALGMLGLLLGFVLMMAIGRWDARRDVLLHEANTIGTLSLRAGLLEPTERNELRKWLREYTDARITLGVSVDDPEAWQATRKKSEKLHAEIWSAVERAGTEDISPAKLTTLITAANELIDLHETRISSMENFLPASLLFLLLFVAAVAVYFLSWSFGATGHGGRVSMLLLALVIVAILFLIMDVNRPQRGTFQIGVEPLQRVQAGISDTGDTTQPGPGPNDESPEGG